MHKHLLRAAEPRKKSILDLFRNLFNTKIMGAYYVLGPSSTFVDLGHGFARVVFAAACLGEVFETCGIELMTSRFDASTTILAKLRILGLPVKSKITLVQGNITDPGTSHTYICLMLRSIL